MGWQNWIRGGAIATASVGLVIACSSSSDKVVIDPAVDASSPSSPQGSGSDAAAASDVVSSDVVAVDVQDATPPADAADAGDATDGADADAHAPLTRVSGHVDYNGPVVAADVQLLAPFTDSTTTDQNGDFAFYVPLGSQAVFKVTATDASLYPMIRGLVAAASNRIRVFYLAGPPEQQAAQSLGKSFDTSKGIVEVDFRNSSIGGYGVTLATTTGGAAVTPGFGFALDDTSTPQLTMSTLTGGDGSTLLLGDVAASSMTFTPTVPADAGLPCKPCDGVSLPVEANVVTWFDFECGTATDCE